MDYIIDLGIHLKKQNPDFSINAYKINTIHENGEFNCDVSNDLLET
jgi:hypothetical protein